MRKNNWWWLDVVVFVAAATMTAMDVMVADIGFTTVLGIIAMIFSARSFVKNRK